MSKFCYWSVADGKYGKMMETLIESARRVGVKEDFHIWSDRELKGAITHPCGTFVKDHYLFKFRFLYNEVKKLDYDYFIFLDADNFFVRHPGDGTFDLLLRDNPMFCQMENDCTSKLIKRKDWWGIPIKFYPQTLWFKGVKTKTVWNTNAGFWIVKKEFIEKFYEMAMEFWYYVHHELGVKLTEEAPLAYVGHIMQKDPEQNTLSNTCLTWASDWTGNFSKKLPTGTPWTFENYMTGERQQVNPAIVHCMRGDDLLVKGFEDELNYVI